MMNWRKSKRSLGNGNCLEVAGDWRKPQRSLGNGNCVEVSSGVMVRDTADRDGVTLTFPGVSWGKFLDTLR